MKGVGIVVHAMHSDQHGARRPIVCIPVGKPQARAVIADKLIPIQSRTFEAQGRLARSLGHERRTGPQHQGEHQSDQASHGRNMSSTLWRR